MAASHFYLLLEGFFDGCGEQVEPFLHGLCGVRLPDDDLEGVLILEEAINALYDCCFCRQDFFASRPETDGPRQP